MTSAPGARILIAEDSPTQAAMLRAILEEEDFRVGLARDGREAARLFDREVFGIVLSDIVMPGMDGFELCRHVKRSNPARSIPVILLTAMNDPLDIARGLESGADDFVAKPYDPGELVGKIRGLLARATTPGGGSAGEHDDRSRMIGLLVGAFEASAHKGAELETRTAELADARRRLADAGQGGASGISAAPDPVGVLTIDRTGVVTGINATGAGMLGWGPAEMIGRKFAEAMLPLAEAGATDRSSSVAGVLNGGTAFDQVDAVFRLKTGEGRPVRHAGTPMMNESDGLIGVLVVFRIGPSASPANPRHA